MRPFTSTISLDEARRRLASNASPIERVERLALGEAAGRVMAEDVAAAMDVPAFARASMDGYAVIAANTVAAAPESPVRLRLVDRVFTGQLSTATIVAGTCAEIATGAPMPDGADAVIMVEETSVEGDCVLMRASTTPGRNVGRRAADIAAGEIVVRAGDLLTPSRVGALAAIGQASVTAFAKPRVAILSTGNEVVEPGRPLISGQVYDVNRFTLSAIVAAHGGMPQPHQAARDAVEALTDALDACAGADLVVFSGGSSVGTRDLVTDLVNARGRMVFHGVAIKPGKPTAFALIGQTPFFGMPGNPSSCLSNAYILLIPYLRSIARLPPHEPRVVRVPLAQQVASSAGRHQFFTVRIRDNAAHAAFKGSGDITSLSEADGYIEIAADQGIVEAGTVVSVTLF